MIFGGFFFVPSFPKFPREVPGHRPLSTGCRPGSWTGATGLVVEKKGPTLSPLRKGGGSEISAYGDFELMKIFLAYETTTLVCFFFF